jgi:hypothetical protein
MLKDQIDKDYLESYKAGQAEKVSVLRMIKSALQNTEIAKKDKLSDSEVSTVLKKEIKQRLEAAEMYEKAGEIEKKNREYSDVKIIEEYLPKQLDETQTREIVKKTLAENSIIDKSKMGQAIGLIMKEHGSEVDGKIVSRIVAEELS